MLITDLAFRDLEQEAHTFAGSLAHMLGRLRSRSLTAAHPSVDPGTGGDQVTSPTIVRFPGADRASVATSGIAPHAVEHVNPGPGANTLYKWRRHPLLLHRSGDNDDRTDEERQRVARAAAVRGMFLARSERLAEARSAFTQAAEDETLDLSELPGFWRLSRSAMLVVADAYEDVGRFRDASALSAQVRTTFRPRAVDPVRHPSRRDASGGGL